MFRSICAIAVLLLVAAGAEAQTPPSPVASGAAPAVLGSASATDTPADYVLGPADVIEVSILGRSEYTSRGRIAEDGTILLQYLGAVVAANKTSAQLSDDIAKALEKGGFYSHPVVRVDVVSYASRYVTVLGAVATPGLVPVDRPYRLSEIVARVGGIRESGADYVILRPLRGAERRVLISTLATGAASDDPSVSPGDKIYSPPAEVFYLSGQVKAPGAFPMTANLTVRQALSRAGGVTDSGTEKKVSITRKGERIGRVDLNSNVQPGDIITVGERLF